MFQCTALWQPPAVFFLNTLIDTIYRRVWSQHFAFLCAGLYCLGCSATGYKGDAISFQETHNGFQGRFDICGRRPASSSANYSFASTQVCVRTKDFLLAVKTFFRCAGCLKTKGIYWGLICLSIFYLQPDRCKRLFLQPPASHSRCPSFKGPFEK